jgi:hypothetical protein
MNNRQMDSVMKQIYTKEVIEELAAKMLTAFEWGKNNLLDSQARERIKEWELNMKEKYLK